MKMLEESQKYLNNNEQAQPEPISSGSILTPENIKKWEKEALDNADNAHKELLSDRLKYYERYLEG